jgi:membrane protein CcdC involved in cytochrome C biogenesis
MFKKELREIWKPVLLRFSVVLALPVFMAVQKILTSKMIGAQATGFILMPFSVVMIWIANFLGVTVFKAEFEDRALEYWLTFPYGMLGIMARKMASRIALVLLMAIIYAVLFIFAVTNKLNVINPASLCLLTVLIFINGSLCGFLSNRNLRMVANVVTFFSFVVLSLGLSHFVLLLFPEGNPLPAAVSSISAFLLVIGIMGGTFLFSARKFDLRSPELFMKRVRAFSLPLILALDIAALIFRYA